MNAPRYEGEWEEEVRTQYSETTFDNVLDYFVKGYRLKKGETIWNHEAVCDPRTGKIIIKLMITEPAKDGE